MVGPFEFIILLLSFVYTLALTHLLFAATRMLRHRRQLTLSWPHLLWMFVALLNLVANWISLWDFRKIAPLPLGTIAGGFLLAILNYFMSALVSPDFEAGESYDMQQFHRCEGPTYISSILVMVLVAIATNYLAGADLDVTNFANENWLVMFMVPPLLLGLAVRRPWAQLLAPLLMLALTVAYYVLYYPVLAN
jgi:hypothetical protein